MWTRENRIGYNNNGRWNSSTTPRALNNIIGEVTLINLISTYAQLDWYF